MIFDVSISVIGSTVGAFFGFLGAIILHNINVKRNKKNKIETVLKNIQYEITQISRDLNKLYFERNEPYPDKIQTPIMDAAIYSGAILDFIEDPLYNQAIRVYSYIKHFNDLEEPLCDTYKNLEYQKKIIDESHNITTLKER